MARAAYRGRRYATTQAQLACALVVGVAVPAMALAGTAAPAAAGVTVAVAGTPDYPELSYGAADPIEPPSTEPADPTEPPPTEPAPSQSPIDSSGPPDEPTKTPSDPTKTPAGPSEPPDEPTTNPAEPSAGSTTSAPPGDGFRKQPSRAPGPVKPGQDQLGVSVSTGDVRLPIGYWNSSATVAELRVTIQNTGRVEERVRLRYTLPSGLRDAGTRGCRPTGARSYRCAAWTAAVGDRWSTRLKVRVAGDAWKSMPLSGWVQVTATSEENSGEEVRDEQGFAVLFPAGPPVAGMTLSASDVAFDPSGQPAPLRVILGNTGKADATGAVEIILPNGVTVPALPAGCRSTTAGRTACELGVIRAGRSVVLSLSISAAAEAQRLAPLSGAVVGTLWPRAGVLKRMQMSFRIAAAADRSPSGVTATDAGDVLAAGHRAGGGRGPGVQQLAISLIVVSVLLVMLALTLAMTSLRQRLSDDPPAPEAVPAD